MQRQRNPVHLQRKVINSLRTMLISHSRHSIKGHALILIFTKKMNESLEKGWSPEIHFILFFNRLD
ncbi:hypothetical protein CHS0354_011636 [Potamilus streckersoni]|uniref:Uncharacterized protein n=1 Tax=Potamilus streckersoni TaxID=2493646 RepID=A0AAE0TK58_9BIVA|nr:hypothetical protein CHS0354_011636 [Potamilus streckersoni]